MKAKKCWVFAGLLSMCSVAICATSTLTNKQLALQGIDALRVHVLLTENTIKAGLSKSQVQTDVELKLRRNGIRILSKQEYGPELTVNITSVPVQLAGPGYLLGIASFIEISLDDYVQVLRNKCLGLGTIWKTGTIISAKREEFPQEARRDISDGVDKFLNDYLAANPKESAPAVSYLDAAKWAEGKAIMGTIATAIRAWLAETNQSGSWDNTTLTLARLGFIPGDLSGNYFDSTLFSWTVSYDVAKNTLKYEIKAKAPDEIKTPKEMRLIYDSMAAPPTRWETEDTAK